MSLYLFYPTHPDGIAPSFDTAECRSDAAAVAHARIVLDQHSSATSVVVCTAIRYVHTELRDRRESRTSLSRSLSA